MPIRFLVPLLVAAVVLVGCVPAAASEDSGQETRAESAAVAAGAPAIDPIASAGRILRERFPQTGWAESVTMVAFERGLLQVTLNRPTTTIGEVEVFSRMCNALTALITTGDNPSPVLGIQFYRADGAAMVASGTANTPCSRFHR